MLFFRMPLSCPAFFLDAPNVRRMPLSSEILLFMGCAQNLPGGCSPGPNLGFPQLCLGCCRMRMPARVGAWYPPPARRRRERRTVSSPPPVQFVPHFSSPPGGGGGTMPHPALACPSGSNPNKVAGALSWDLGSTPPKDFEHTP